MGIDSLRDVAASVAKDAALGCLVSAGIVQQRCYRVPTIVCGVPIGANEPHHGTPYVAVPAVVIRLPGAVSDEVLSRRCHPGLDKR